MPIKTYFIRLSILALAGLGQTLIAVYAFSFFDALKNGPLIELPLQYNSLDTRVLAMEVTLWATLLSFLVTSFFTLVVKEALRHRMHDPISLKVLQGGIAFANCGVFFTSDVPITLVTLAIFVASKLMVSSWSTALALKATSTTADVSGKELDLGSSYFESRLHQQLLASGGAIASNSNSTKVISTGSLLSGIVSASVLELDSKMSSAMSFNGVSYNMTTGGVLPAVPGYLGKIQEAQSGNTGLSFVGGLLPTNLSTPSGSFPLQMYQNSYTISQQGLTAQVNCTQVDAPGLVTTNSTIVDTSFPNGATLSLTAYSFQMQCNEGTPAQETYVTRSNDDSNSPIGLVYSLVCPYPVNQSQQIDWTQFNVTSGSAVSDKYGFLQLTTCEIIPQLTTSAVTYANDTVAVSVVQSTPLNASNGNLSLYLASVIEYQTQNLQGLTSNTFGDVLYSVAVTTSSNLSLSGPMAPELLSEIEQYWRGVIEFAGTYLRSGFSVTLTDIEADGLRWYSGNLTLTGLGRQRFTPLHLYIYIPIALFLLSTYAAIAYVLYALIWKKGCRFTIFDPTKPLHLIMVSSTRYCQPDMPETSKEASDNTILDLKGEQLGDFSKIGIKYNQTVNVQLVDAEGGNNKRTMRKRFTNVTLSEGGLDFASHLREKHDRNQTKNQQAPSDCGSNPPLASE